MRDAEQCTAWFCCIIPQSMHGTTFDGQFDAGDFRRMFPKPAPIIPRPDAGTLLASLLLWALLVPTGSASQARASEPSDAQPDSPAWHRTLRLVRDEYPDVPQITTRKLASLLADGTANTILLLDARTRAEYRLSHLKGAVHAGDTASALRAIGAHPPGSTIVVYCSVGYRSARLANRLRQRGITNVFNLEGSLFQWANEGRHLYRGPDRVHEAHPYDRNWGRLLERRYRSH